MAVESVFVGVFTGIIVVLILFALSISKGWLRAAKPISVLATQHTVESNTEVALKTNSDILPLATSTIDIVESPQKTEVEMAPQVLTEPQTTQTSSVSIDKIDINGTIQTLPVSTISQTIPQPSQPKTSARRRTRRQSTHLRKEKIIKLAPQ